MPPVPEKAKPLGSKACYVKVTDRQIPDVQFQLIWQHLNLTMQTSKHDL